MKKKIFMYILPVIIVFAVIFIGDSCIIRNITGLPCPSCGMTRAYFAFFKGDIKTAFFYHPLFWLVPIIFISLTSKKVRNNKPILCSFIAIFLSVYIIRMILYFPHTPPLDYNSDSYLSVVWKIIVNLIERICL